VTEFNPYGLHSIRIPLGLLLYPGVSPGAKLLYGRLLLFRGREPDGYCNPGLKQMAAEMGGVSLASIKRWLAELVEHGFIRRQRRQRQEAENFFLHHPSFFDSPGLGKEVFDGSNLTPQEVLDGSKLHSRELNSEVFDGSNLNFSRPLIGRKPTLKPRGLMAQN